MRKCNFNEIQVVQRKNEEQLILEKEKRMLEISKREEKIRRMARMREFEADMLLEKIYSKDYRIREFKEQKEIIQQEKLQMAEETQKSKERYLDKFNKILAKSKLNVFR